MGRPYFSQSTNQQFEDNLAGFSVHYEPDVWGKIHNAVSASKAQALATESDLATLSLSIHAELAADYFNLRCADQTQQYLDDMVFTSTKTRNLIQQLFHGGLAPATDVAQAELQRQNAITAAIDNKIKRGQIEHAIATLTGQNPANFVLKAELDVIPLIPTFEIGLPSNLLERRPDVASAERRLMAANASVGIAKSAFFPSFGLNAAAGYESSSLANWFKAPNLFWSVGPSAALTIFDGGLRTAQVDQAKSVVVEATADYRQTVLDALKETEDNLIALKGLEREHDSASSALDATKTTLAMAEARYKGGIASDLDVTQAQMIDLQSHIVLTTIEARRQVATVLLVKALGGGWSSAPQ
jgi:NodT family efflux transporter outer membrane factor (OMF) lipoprotein